MFDDFLISTHFANSWFFSSNSSFFSDKFSDFLTRCVQDPALAQSLGSYTRLSLQERERWLSETVGETLHVDPAQINALRMYSSTTDFAKGVAKHVHSVLYEEYVEMEAI